MLKYKKKTQGIIRAGNWLIDIERPLFKHRAIWREQNCRRRYCQIMHISHSRDTRLQYLKRRF